MAKAPNENGSDGEERKLGEQKGLDIENFVRIFRESVSVFFCSKSTEEQTKISKLLRLITPVVLAVNSVN